MATGSHEELLVWQKSVDLSVQIYRMTETFPHKEMYGITSQMRRAAVSIPSNIAEGRRRGTRADFRHFLHIAHGSLAELETQLLITRRLCFCDEALYFNTKEMTIEVGKILHAMIKGLQ